MKPELTLNLLEDGTVACENCGGTGEVPIPDCNHQGKCDCGPAYVGCGRCMGSRCEHCDHCGKPARRLTGREYLCDSCP